MDTLFLTKNGEKTTTLGAYLRSPYKEKSHPTPWIPSRLVWFFVFWFFRSLFQLSFLIAYERFILSLGTVMWNAWQRF